MQQEHEHHRLLDLNSHHKQTHDDSSGSFVGHADNSSSHHHHHHQPITTNPKYTKRQQDRTTQPSLWNTKEFYVYYLVFMLCVPYMFKTAHEASSGMDAIQLLSQNPDRRYLLRCRTKEGIVQH